MGFKVLLKDKREEYIEAEGYQEDIVGNYAFTKEGKIVAKFPIVAVVGVIERDPPSQEILDEDAISDPASGGLIAEMDAGQLEALSRVLAREAADRRTKESQP